MKRICVMLEKGMGDEFVERRAHPRIPISVRVRVQYTGQEFTADSVNLSAGGVFLDTDHRLPVGTRIHMVFTVPIIAKYPIRAEGEIVRLGSEGQIGLAIRFVDISDDDRALLGELAEKSDSLLGEG
jgi:uncharacterized protein (TIGR02266 family)